MTSLMMLVPVLFACLAVFEASRGIAALRYGERRAPLLLIAAASYAAVSGVMAYLFTR